MSAAGTEGGRRTSRVLQGCLGCFPRFPSGTLLPLLFWGFFIKRVPSPFCIIQGLLGNLVPMFEKL